MLFHDTVHDTTKYEMLPYTGHSLSPEKGRSVISLSCENVQFSLFNTATVK